MRRLAALGQSPSFARVGRWVPATSPFSLELGEADENSQRSILLREALALAMGLQVHFGLR